MMNRWRAHWGRAPLGAVIFCALTLASCATNAQPGNGATGGPGDIVLNVGTTATTPTPQFYGVTVGAWISNPTPNVGENITVYALVRNQPTDQKSPGLAPNPPDTVTFNVAPVGAGGQKLTGTTDASGYVAIPTQAIGTPGQPTQIYVAVTAGNQTVAQTVTFYTMLPGAPPTATPGGNVTPTATP